MSTGSNLAGPAYAMAAMLFFSGNDVLIKYLSGTHALHLLVFTRCTIALVLIVVAVWLFGPGLGSLRTRRLTLHIVRGLLVVTANMAFFLAVAALPLATCVAIFFVSPLLISVFSVVFLGETVGPRRWAAIAVGLVGVLIIVQPGTEAFRPATLLPALSAACYAGLNIMTRVVGRTDSTAALAFYTQIVFIVTSLAIGLAVGDGRFATQDHPSAAFFFRAWAWPDTSDWPLLFLLGICVGAGATLISAAYRASEAALVAPFEYIAVPFSIFWGGVLCGEWPGATTWAGIALIVGAGLFMIWRETHPDTPPPAAAPRTRR